MTHYIRQSGPREAPRCSQQRTRGRAQPARNADDSERVGTCLSWWFLAAIDADCDVLTQHVDHDQLRAEVEFAADSSQLVDAWD